MDSIPLPDRREDRPLRWLDAAQRYGLWFLAVLGAVVIYRSWRDFVFEDAYITYRYAKNISDGAGFVFQQGERVLGTMPLYTLLLALGHWLGADIPTLSGMLFAGSIGAIGLLGGLLLRRLGSPNAALLFAAACVCGFTQCFRFFGIETPFITALVLAAVLAAVSGQDVLAAALAALAFLTRYDAALFAILMLLVLWVSRRRLPWTAAAVSLAIALPWMLFARLYFGSWTPNTLAAKAGASDMLHYLVRSGRLISTEAWLPLQRLGGKFLSSATALQSANIAVLLGILLAVYHLRRRSAAFLLLVAYPIALWLGYGYVGPPVVFRWYLIPGAFLLLLAAFAGWSLAADRVGFARLRFLAALLLAGTAMFLQPKALAADVAAQTFADIYGSRIGAYARISDWIRQKHLESLTLLTGEPGYLTYHSGNPVIDGAGLVTEGVHYFGSSQPRTDFAELIAMRKPPLIIGEFPYRPSGYVLVRSEFFYIQLFMSVEQHRALYRTLGPEPSDAEAARSAPPLRHPFELDAEIANRRAWNTSGGTLRGIGRPFPLSIDGKPVTEDYLFLQGYLSGAETPSFLIDFDLLEFRFASTNPGPGQADETVAQLVIDERVVMQEGGRRDRSDNDFPQVVWPVHSWRGRTARLRFVSMSSSGRWLAADHIRSRVEKNAVCLDDFEGAGGFGDFWADPGDLRPTDMQTVAAEHGLEFLTSPHAATSFRDGGEYSLTSKPFVIDRDQLSCVMYDFGAQRTALALVIAGRPVREARGRGTKKNRPIHWDLREFRGRTAVLKLIDQSPTRLEWIGIDDIHMADD